MRFVCESCRAQYMINDEKVGPKGVKVRCRKCGYVILVKRGGDAQAKSPVNSAGADPDDALATQVLQSPLASPLRDATDDSGGDTMVDMTNPGTSAPPVAPPPPPADSREALLGDAGDDEIGAVFDQVLNSGEHSIAKDPLAKSDDRNTEQHAAVGGAELGGDDDRMSTRVIDGNVVRKLAEEMGAEKSSDDKPFDEKPFDEKPADAKAPEKNGHPTEGEVPQTDWFAAIDEKQTGPLTLEKMKEHWDRGQLGPDSLCWRAGFTDWVPLSEVAQLASVLAPRPASKPIVMNAPTPGAASVVSVPVESAFSAGGMMKSVRSEVQVPLGGPHSRIEETGSWRPSAANSLTSLLKDERAAQARPAASLGDDPPNTGEAPVNGLLDLPALDEKPATGGRTNGHAGASVDPSQAREMPSPRRAQAPANPYVATPGATYSSPGLSQYRPPSNRNLLIAIGVGGGAMVLLLIGLVIWLGGKVGQPPPVTVVAQAPAPVAPPPQPVPVQAAPAPSVAVPPPQPAPVQPPAAAPAQPVSAAPAPVGAPAPVSPPSAKPQPLPPHAGQQQAQPSTPRPTAPSNARPAADKPPAEKQESKPKASASDDDGDFDKAFGGGDKKEAPKAEAKKKPTVWVPAAPGSASNDVKDSLGQSDVLEVVRANQGALAKCVEEQRKKEPGVSGKLVMKWSIQTSGKVTNVSVQSEEFKTTYIASCIGGVIKALVFPKVKTAPDPVVFPFKF